MRPGFGMALSCGIWFQARCALPGFSKQECYQVCQHPVGHSGRCACALHIVNPFAKPQSPDGPSAVRHDFRRVMLALKRMQLLRLMPQFLRTRLGFNQIVTAKNDECLLLTGMSAENIAEFKILLGIPGTLAEPRVQLATRHQKILLACAPGAHGGVP